MSNYAPVALFIYKRQDHFEKTIEALKKNKLANKTDLYIFSDGAKKAEDELIIKKIREIANSIEGFKSVTVKCAPQNKGLGNSIISGVSDVIAEHGKIIVLEDDLVTSTDFLSVMNQLLDEYQANPVVWSVTAYNNPFNIPKNYEWDAYAIPRICSWGWGTWENRWEKADWEMSSYDAFIKSEKEKKAFNRGGSDLVRMLKHQISGKIDSWAIRWNYAQYKHNAVSMWTTNTYIDNIGMDGEGTHKEKRNIKVEFKQTKGSIKLPQRVEVYGTIERRFRRYIFMHTGLIRRVRCIVGI